MVSTNYTEPATSSTIIPLDNTIPQNTEGTEFMTQAITPKSATNILIIEAVIVLSSNTAAREMVAALFQDTTADAIAASTAYLDATARIVVTIKHKMVAGTTSATTFKVRCGPDSAATIYMNANAAGTRIFGAITKSNITITEYKAS